MKANTVYSKFLQVAAMLALVVSTGAIAHANADAVERALAARHEITTPEQLEALAGGKDALIKRLLVIRTQERPMFAGVRAEKVLLRYSDREDVAAALEQDVNNSALLGLARVVMVNIDQVPQPEVRQRLARAGIERAKREPEFVSFAKVLGDSRDAEVSRLAQENFR